MTEGRGDADDVFQEAWFRVIRKHRSYRAGNFRGWLARITHNLIVDRARKRKPDFSLDASAGEGRETRPAQDGQPEPGRAMAARELGQRIAAAVRSLSPEQREVFLMRSQMELSFKEIARIQSVSINTALARMHYAVGKLRGLLADERRQWQTCG
jgi:RNA polymerase sigma-70 factor (ECF subfamily)